MPLSWVFVFSLQCAHCSPLHATEGRGKSDFTHQNCPKARSSEFLVATRLQTCSWHRALSLQPGPFPSDAPASRSSSAVAEPHRQGGNSLGFFLSLIFPCHFAFFCEVRPWAMHFPWTVSQPLLGNDKDIC